MSFLQTNLEYILNEKETKILPENIKKGVQIFDIVGTLEEGTSGVKLFETQQEMQADESPKEGDLAVVYRSEIQNMTVDTQTQFITFPETVTLLEAFEDSTYIRLIATDSQVMFDGNVQLDKTSFRFDGFSDNGMIRVMYTSSDGITYTRTEFSGDSGELTNPVDLGTIVEIADGPTEWNDTLGHFMQVKVNTFEGLFIYNNSSYILAPTQLNAVSSAVYNSTAYGKNGIIEGTLTQSPSNSFADINAEVYIKLKNIYDNMSPKVLSDDNYRQDQNIQFVPINNQGQTLLDTSALTTMSNIFYNCTKLTYIPSLNTSNVTDMTFAFNGCTNLISGPEMDTSNVTKMNYMFAYDTNLVNIPVYNTSSVKTMDNMFYQCPNLSDDSLNNIMQMCINTTGNYIEGKRLSALSLSQEQITTCTTLSNYEAFTAAGWTTGY